MEMGMRRRRWRWRRRRARTWPISSPTLLRIYFNKSRRLLPQRARLALATKHLAPKNAAVAGGKKWNYGRRTTRESDAEFAMSTILANYNWNAPPTKAVQIFSEVLKKNVHGIQFSLRRKFTFFKVELWRGEQDFVLNQARAALIGFFHLNLFKAKVRSCAGNLILITLQLSRADFWCSRRPKAACSDLQIRCGAKFWLLGSGILVSKQGHFSTHNYIENFKFCRFVEHFLNQLNTNLSVSDYIPLFRPSLST